MQIRRADRSDIRRVAELWIHSFPGERTLAERMHMLETGGAWGGIETVHVVDDGRAVAGALKLQEMTQYFGGEGIPMMGLAAVAVSSAARRRGVGRSLCEYALRVAAERGDALSVLYPFRPEFYARFGWAMVGELRRYRFRPETLAIDIDGPVRLAGADDENGIRACYERYAHRSNGLVARGPRAWRQHLDAADTWAYVHDDDGITGYMLVRYGRSRSPERRPLVVRELVTDDDSAYRALLGWIPRQRDLWRRVQYDAWPEDRFDLLLSSPRPPTYVAARWLWNRTARVLQGPMFRILDVKSAFERRGRWGTDQPISFTLDVRDAHLQRNHGTFSVEWNGTETQVERIASANAGTHVALDIGTLGQLYAGEIRLSDAKRAHRAVIEGETMGVEAFFDAHSSFKLLDEF
jgi:predicted acetyltransferase